MTSPEVIQVSDIGDDDHHLWPSDEIRQKAIDTIMKRCERSCEEKFRATAQRFYLDTENKLKATIEELNKALARSEAANKSLQERIEKAEGLRIEKAESLEVSKPERPEYPAEEPRFSDMMIKLYDLGRIMNTMADAALKAQCDSSTIYQSEMRDRFAGEMFVSNLAPHLGPMASAMHQVANNLGACGVRV
jgi:hypothetical protein